MSTYANQPKTASSAVQKQLSFTQAEKRILIELRNHPDLSRADLVQRLGFSKSTLSTSINKFLATGLISESRETPEDGQVGQPALRLNIVADALHYVGLSISTRGLVAAVVNLACDPIWTSEQHELAHSTPEIIKQSRNLVEQAFEQSDRQTDIGVFIPAAISEAGDILEVTPRQKVVPYEQIIQTLRHHFPDVQTLYSNASDIFLQALEPENYDQVIFLVSFADGVGATLFDRDQIFRGGFNQAANLGGLIPETGPRPSIPDLATHLAADSASLSLDVLEQLYSDRHPGLIAWIKDRGSRLSEPLSTVVQLINPNKIVFSGNFPGSILKALMLQVDLTIHDVSNRLPLNKPELSVARVVGEKSRALSAATIPLARLLYERI